MGGMGEFPIGASKHDAPASVSDAITEHTCLHAVMLCV